MCSLEKEKIELGFYFKNMELYYVFCYKMFCALYFNEIEPTRCTDLVAICQLFRKRKQLTLNI